MVSTKYQVLLFLLLLMTGFQDKYLNCQESWGELNLRAVYFKYQVK